MCHLVTLLMCIYLSRIHLLLIIISSLNLTHRASNKRGQAFHLIIIKSWLWVSFDITLEHKSPKRWYLKGHHKVTVHNEKQSKLSIAHVWYDHFRARRILIGRKAWMRNRMHISRDLIPRWCRVTCIWSSSTCCFMILDVILDGMKENIMQGSLKASRASRTECDTPPITRVD